VRAVSKKRASQLREYKVRRLLFLAEHRWCMRCHLRPTTVLHHRRGRRGLRLLDERWWAASCVPCNDFAETHTGEALTEGWMVREDQEVDPWEC
jgi:hypothetical protein